MSVLGCAGAEAIALDGMVIGIGTAHPLAKFVNIPVVATDLAVKIIAFNMDIAAKSLLHAYGILP